MSFILGAIDGNNGLICPYGERNYLNTLISIHYTVRCEISVFGTPWNAVKWKDIDYGTMVLTTYCHRHLEFIICNLI